MNGIGSGIVITIYSALTSDALLIDTVEIADNQMVLTPGGVGPYGLCVNDANGNNPCKASYYGITIRGVWPPVKDDNSTCRNVTIANNLIVQTPSHTTGAVGVVQCDQMTIQNNTLLGDTAIGLIMIGTGVTPEELKITDNIIANSELINTASRYDFKIYPATVNGAYIYPAVDSYTFAGNYFSRVSLGGTAVGFDALLKTLSANSDYAQAPQFEDAAGLKYRVTNPVTRTCSADSNFSHTGFNYLTERCEFADEQTGASDFAGYETMTVKELIEKAGL